MDPHRFRKTAFFSIIFTLALLFSLLLAADLRELFSPRRHLEAEPTKEAELAVSLESLFSSVAESVRLSVVSIGTTSRPKETSFKIDDPAAEDSDQESIGSGFIVDSRGYILTNQHLVGDANVITVRLHDGRETQARVIQADPSSDIGLIKLDLEGLRPLPMGESEQVRVGQWVLAFGNPFGLTETVSAGIVSALKRSDLRILPFENFIQTDASINPGNSGGPLVNLRGEAIGINTAMYSNPGGGNQGIGFAVPIDMAKALAKRWIEGKSPSFLGVLPAHVDQDMARYYGLKEPRGAFVAHVDSGGPAERAGMKEKDLILTFGPREVRDENHLRVLIASTPPNDPVEVEVIRGSLHEKLKVVLLEKESPRSTLGPGPIAQEDVPKTRLLGITVTPISPQICRELSLSADLTGIVVMDVQAGSPAAKKGLQRGDVIVEVNESRFSGLEDLKKVLESPKDVILFTVIRGGGEMTYLFLPRK
jgi:serine protease Do